MSRIDLLTLAAELGSQTEGLLEPSAAWARLQGCSDDANTVEQQMQSLEMGAGQSTNSGVTIDVIDEKQGDMSSSGSSWAPGPHSAPDSDSEISSKKIKTERVKSYAKQKGKKHCKPSLRPDPELPNSAPNHAQNENPEQSFTSTGNGHENRINSNHEFLKPNTPPPRNSKHKKKNKKVSVEKSNFKLVKSELTVIRNMVHNLKSLSSDIKEVLQGSQKDNGHSQSQSHNSIERLTPEMGGNVENDHSQEGAMSTNTTPRVNTPVNKSSESHLRDICTQNQNIEAGGQSGSKNTSGKKHISIKIANVSGGHVKSESNGMVPIGSGKTLVPKDIYDKINWKSYTMATRKLLMAVFPRSTLATHSLTGKASPAFLTKPAKSCLDPRKVSDIVMTVTAKCHVKEGLVRGAITTKCADENKMLKQRKQKDQRQKSMEASALNKDTENNSSPKP